MSERPEHAPLIETAAFLDEFVHFPSSSSSTVLALTVAMTWTVDAWSAIPYVFFGSKHPGAGKTRALEVLAALTPNSLMVAAATSGGVLRHLGAMQDQRPTLYLDEVDTMLPRGSRVTGDQARFVSLLHSGYRQSGRTLLSVPTDRANEWTATTISSFGAKYLAGPAGSLGSALASRCLTFQMDGTRGSRPPRFLPERTELAKRIDVLATRWANWGPRAAEKYRACEVEDLAALGDREFETAEPLFALAHEASTRAETLRMQKAVLSVMRPGVQEARSDLMLVAEALRGRSLAMISKDELEVGSLVRSVRTIDPKLLKPKEVRIPGTRTNAWGYRLADIDRCLLDGSIYPVILSNPLAFTSAAVAHSKPSKPTNRENIFVKKTTQSASSTQKELAQ